MQALDGGAPRQLTCFTDGRPIGSFAWSRAIARVNDDDFAEGRRHRHHARCTKGRTPQRAELELEQDVSAAPAIPSGKTAAAIDTEGGGRKETRVFS